MGTPTISNIILEHLNDIAKIFGLRAECTDSYRKNGSTVLDTFIITCYSEKSNIPLFKFGVDIKLDTIECIEDKYGFKYTEFKKALNIHYPTIKS